MRRRTWSVPSMEFRAAGSTGPRIITQCGLKAVTGLNLLNLHGQIVARGNRLRQMARQRETLTSQQVKAIEAHVLSLCYLTPVEVLKIVRDTARSFGLEREEKRFVAAIGDLEEQ